jgi:type I restriction-modification system DNA methylase subunit
MSSSQKHPEVAVLRPYLLDCGYRASRLAMNIEVENGHRYKVPLAAFAHSPHDSRSACIAIMDGASDPEATVASCRGLGAPLVFLYFPDQWQLWQQSTTKPKLLRQISPAELPHFFLEKKEDLAPESVYRAKTWARFDTSYQLDFVDVGLMPLVEEEAGRKLTELIERVVQGAKSRLHWDEVSQRQGQWLLQSHFWLLAAKILKDKNVPAFATLDLENVQNAFAHVADHYGAATPVQIGTKPQAEALRESAREMSRFSHLGLVSTDALAYLYEHALITPEIRAALGTYSTPTYLVDYIIGKLRPWIEDIPVSQRQVFEPACGHAAFLLAAMQLLGDLLPEGMSSPSKRHEYLRPRLHGYDIDSFALEIARLRLTLADAPNPNGWDLQVADMFEGDSLDRSSQDANIILANPPFKNLSATERRQAENTLYVNTTAEVLNRIAASMRSGAVFGMIVPQGLLHSSNAASLRELLATDFEISEICLLPDKVFTSDAESAVLLGRRLYPGRQNQRSVLYRRVREQNIENFKRSYEATYESHVPMSRFSETDSWNFFVPDLEEVWKFCQGLPTFGSIAEIGQGFQFRSKNDPQFPEGAITESKTPRDGLVEGFSCLRKTLQTYQQPDKTWLNLDLSVIRRPGHGRTTGIPQVLLNYARVSRESWRLKAFLDKEGHPVTSRFLVIRPYHESWPLEALWGICNSPLANAYSYTFSTKRGILAGLIKEMPIPNIELGDVTQLTEAVKAYLRVACTQEDGSLAPNIKEELKILHWRIDAEVLRLYGLPPHLERQLLDLFSGVARRGVPFKQKEYFLEGFTEISRLRELLAITVDWEKTNERRFQLIEKEVKRNILADEKIEFDYLQQLTDARIELLAPLPIKQLEELREELKRRGMWEGE